MSRAQCCSSHFGASWDAFPLISVCSVQRITLLSASQAPKAAQAHPVQKLGPHKGLGELTRSRALSLREPEPTSCPSGARSPGGRMEWPPNSFMPRPWPASLFTPAS